MDQTIIQFHCEKENKSDTLETEPDHFWGFLLENDQNNKSTIKRCSSFTGGTQEVQSFPRTLDGFLHSHMFRTLIQWRPQTLRDYHQWLIPPKIIQHMQPPQTARPETSLQHTRIQGFTDDRTISRNTSLKSCRFSSSAESQSEHQNFIIVCLISCTDH